MEHSHGLWGLERAVRKGEHRRHAATGSGQVDGGKEPEQPGGDAEMGGFRGAPEMR